MSRKYSLGFTLIGTICAIFTMNVNSTQLKTSSLTIIKTSSENKASLSPQCIKMFKEGDKLISEAEKQPGTHTQVSQMKSKLSSSKEQILKMDKAMQDKSCDKGLIALNQLKQKYSVYSY